MKKKLGVIFGGVSGEHEVSKVTAFSVMNNIDFSKFDVQAFYIDLDGVWHTSVKPFTSKTESFADVDSIIKELTIQNPNLFELKSSIDVMFPLVHGTNGEDGTLQGLLEILSIPYVGCGVVGSAMGMDKAIMKEIFSANDIPQGRYVVFNKKETENIDKVVHNIIPLGLPLFVKPANAGSSLGISKVKNLDDLENAIKFALRYDNKIVIEEELVGRELEIGILGYNELSFSAVGEVSTTNNFYDYTAKYNDETVTKIDIPANVPDSVRFEMIKIASDVCRSLNCFGLSRIDFFWNEENNQFYVNEINTIPGFTPYSMYPRLFGEVGIDYSTLIEKLIDAAFEAHHDKKNTRSFSKN